MKKIAEFFVVNLRFTMMLNFCVVIAGYFALAGLNSESFPNVNLGKVVVSTYYRGASTEDIESKITKPLEEEIRSVSGIKRVRSISQPGLSTISTEVDIDHYDVEDVVADLQRAVDSTSELPADLEKSPSFIEIKVDEMPIIELSVKGGENSYGRELVAYTLAEELRDNKKISRVSLQGYNEPQFKVRVDMEKLDQLYVSLKEVIGALQSTTLSIPAGFVEGQDDKYLIKIDGKLKDIDKIKEIVVRSANSGKKIYLKDVAEIILEGAKNTEKVLVDGEPAVNLILAKKASEDIIELSSDIKSTLSNYTKKYQGYNFSIYNDEGLRVGNRLSVLYSNALFGLVLVVFFLLVFLSGRAGIMTSFSLPLAVLATFIYMQVTGMSLNTITIMALIISIGMLVDNSVVISENFTRLCGQGMSPKDAAIKSIASLWAPVTATALTTIAAFLPMMVTKGIMGQFILGIPLIVTASLLFSLFESFFFLPARLVVTAKKNQEAVAEEGEDWFSKLAMGYFKPLLVKSLRHRYITLLFFTFLIFSSILVMTVFNKFILFPASQTEIYISRVELKEGTPLEKTNEKLQEISAAVKETLGSKYKAIVGISGNSMTDWSDPKGKNADSVAILKIFMSDEGRNNNATADILKDLRAIKIPDLKRLTFEALANGPPVGDPLTLRMRSSNEAELSEMTSRLLEYLGAVKGIVDLRLNEQYSEPEVSLKIDTIKAQSLGLTLKDVGTAFQIAFSGIPVNDVNIDNREVDYFVEMNPKDRAQVEDIMKIKILNRYGKLISVAEFAQIEESKPSTFIERYDFKRTKTITSDIQTELITSMEANNLAASKFKELNEEYPSVSMVFGGEAENTAESMESLANAMFLAVLGIFALLILVFNSYTSPFIVLSTVPLGLVGVSYAFYLQSLPVSFLAMIGVVGLSGIIVNSGIVLISFIEEKRAEKPDADLVEVLAESSIVRLKAVIITSLTTISGLIPTAYGIGGNDDFIRPMAMSISWGLVSGTLLTLVWVPCAYLIVYEFKKRIGFKKA